MLSWEPGFNKVSLTKLIREYCVLSLKEAKEKTDALLDHKIVTLEIIESKVATDFVREATKLGVNCELAQ